MNFLHYNDHLSVGDGFRVTLNSQANVCLLDDSNFATYRSGRGGYRYYGGRQERSPVVLSAPYSGHWHLVIDLGGYAGRIQAGVSVLKAA